MTGTAVHVDLLRMTYGHKVALHDVTFSIPSSSICGLIGPNGAGKTSALRIIATDLVPTAGKVELFGRDALCDYAAVRPRLGFMTDDPELFEDMMLESYLTMFAALYGLDRAAQRAAVAATVEMVGLQAFRGRQLRALSKGEAQRVALARTLVHSPELLILDEPAEGLDPRGRIELRELLVLLRERGTTILVSSHILADLEAICDRVVLLHGGRIAFAGTGEELRRREQERERIAIDVFAGLEAARALLSRLDGLRVLHEQSGTIEVELTGGPAKAAALLESLVAGGVRLSGFRPRSSSLEELFLRLTAPGDGGEASR